MVYLKHLAYRILGYCKQNIVILSNNGSLALDVSEMAPGYKFWKEMGLRKDELRQEGVPHAQFIAAIKEFFSAQL